MNRVENWMVMASDNNNDNDNKDNQVYNDNKDNSDDQDNSGNEDDDTNNDEDDEDNGNDNEDKDSTAVAAGGFVSGGGVSGGNCGGVGGGGFGRWWVVVVVGLAGADSSGGAPSRREPCGRCLKRLMGSRAMANEAIDIQGKAGAGGRGGWRWLFLFLSLCIACVDGFHVCKIFYLSICRGTKNLQIDKGLSVLQINLSVNTLSRPKKSTGKIKCFYRYIIL
jgi:hypothetical protein